MSIAPWPLWRCAVRPPGGDPVTFAAIRAPNERAAAIQAQDGYHGLLPPLTPEQRERLAVDVQKVADDRE